MKSNLFIFCILIILFKTGNVLSNENIFNVDNIEINKGNSLNKEKIANNAFKKGYIKLINRLLLEKDFKQLSKTNLNQIKKLISHYQITGIDKQTNKIKVNIFFDKEKVHNYFYVKNILYSDIVNTDVVFFPLLVMNNEYFIYSKNYFVENWNLGSLENLIQYILPLESIENIQKIEKHKDKLMSMDLSDFFQEYSMKKNLIFATVEIKNDKAKIFLKTKIEGKKINKTLEVDNENFSQEMFNDKVILEIKKLIEDLIKSQNLIDVRTPSFLNVKMNLKKNNSLVEFDSRLRKIDLIDNFYVQQLNKDYVLLKIRYLGKIDKIINKLKDQNINLKMTEGQWQMNII